LHKGALLLSEPYRWALVIRPNDPRENRIPKSLISSIYKLVASRKEQCKSEKKSKCFSMGKESNNISINLRNASGFKKSVLIRPRTTSDLSNSPQRHHSVSAAKSETADLANLSKQLTAMCIKMEHFQSVMEKKMEAFEATLDSRKKQEKENEQES